MLDVLDVGVGVVVVGMLDVLAVGVVVVGITEQFAAAVPLDVPAAQSMHTPLPKPALYFPALHARHDVGAADILASAHLLSHAQQ